VQLLAQYLPIHAIVGILVIFIEPPEQLRLLFVCR